MNKNLAYFRSLYRLKIGIVLSFLFFIFCTDSCKTNNYSKNDLNSKVQIRVSLGGDYVLNNSDIVIIVAKVKNISSDTISFLSMSCSTEDVWRTTTSDLELGLKLCFSNVPILIKLESKEIITFYLVDKVKKSLPLIEMNNFNIGFNFIETNTSEYETSVKKIQTINNIIWSTDTLQLKNLFSYKSIIREN